MVSIIGRKGRAFVDKLSIAKPAESTWQVFQSSEFFLKARKTWTKGPRWNPKGKSSAMDSYPSEKEMANAHKHLPVSLNSLMACTWLWHPSPVILLGRIWFSSHPRGRCGFPDCFFFKKLFMYLILVVLALHCCVCDL